MYMNMLSPSLLAGLRCDGEVHLVVGVTNMAWLKIARIFEAGADVKLIGRGDSQRINDKIEEYQKKGNIEWLDRDFELSDLKSLGRDEVDKIVDKVFVTLPMAEAETKKRIFESCKRLRIPVNTSDSPDLCTLTLLSTYRSGDFQMGVSTLGKGCKLAARLKRELSSKLPPNIGEICDKIGELRSKIQQEDEVELERLQEGIDAVGENDDDAINTSKLNDLVYEFSMTKEQQKLQRTRWLSQIVEYYPLEALAQISAEDLIMSYRNSSSEKADQRKRLVEGDDTDQDRKTRKVSRSGKISLVGAGPGSVSLLTIAAIQEIHTADLVLADKLVPQQVLDLVPKHGTRLFIARKFPGNAERAQEELLELGLEALSKGEKVVRLKQGDPYIFGRGGEEFKFFSEHGYTPLVVPGITSALAAPVLNEIPVTQRDVADQVLICTGTGRRGAVPNLPEYVKSRTTIFLMALHRAADLIPKLINEKQWDPTVPAAIIERASCPDQRIIRTTLEDVGAAIEACGSRPPGLLVTGYACEALKASRTDRWQVEEGYQKSDSPDILNYAHSLLVNSSTTKGGDPKTVDKIDTGVQNNQVDRPTIEA